MIAEAIRVNRRASAVPSLGDIRLLYRSCFLSFHLALVFHGDLERIRQRPATHFLRVAQVLSGIACATPLPSLSKTYRSASIALKSSTRPLGQRTMTSSARREAPKPKCNRRLLWER